MACGYCYGSLLNAKKDHFPTQINIQGLNKVRIKKIGIVIFDNIERLDFDGPMGVFGWINKLGEGVDIKLLSLNGEPIRDHLLKKVIQPDADLNKVQNLDLLIIPGGPWKDFLYNEELVYGIAKAGSESKIVASVCSGAFLVAKAGLATNKKITTHSSFYQDFKDQNYNDVVLVEDRRYVQDDTLWSSAGISAGIDMSLKMIIEYWSIDLAKRIRNVLEYYPEPPFKD